MDAEDGKLLLKLARDSIVSQLSGKDIDLEPYKKFNKKQGVFVTLNKHGRLRGCIGFPYPTQVLYEGVFDAARASAFEDHRFEQVKENELKDIDIDISVLSVPEELTGEHEDYIRKINIGEDGLIIKSPLTSGLLLPQVFTEHDCTPEQALEMVCEKAGLPHHAWKDSSVKISKFQADIFSEK